MGMGRRSLPRLVCDAGYDEAMAIEVHLPQRRHCVPMATVVSLNQWSQTSFWSRYFSTTRAQVEVAIGIPLRRLILSTEAALSRYWASLSLAATIARVLLLVNWTAGGAAQEWNEAREREREGGPHRIHPSGDKRGVEEKRRR